jgi:F-type H+-transporting ATPase subunit b
MDLKDQYDEKMKHAGQDAHVIIETARNSANEQKKQILTQAEKEATRIKEKAQEDIDRDRLKAQDDMKNAIGDVAIEAAKKLVDKDMDETTQRKFVDDFINQVGDSQW